MSGGYEVDLTSLVHAAEGVNGVISDMEHSKVSDIGCPGADYGDGNLASVMSDFCSRWEIGVEHLTKDASEVASRLGIMFRRSSTDPAASSW